MALQPPLKVDRVLDHDPLGKVNCKIVVKEFTDGRTCMQ